MENFYKMILDNIDLNIVVKNIYDEVIYCNNNLGIQLSKINKNKENELEYQNNIYSVRYYEVENNKIETYENINNYNKEILKLKKDYLTNLFNRHAIFEKLEKINEEIKITGGNYSIIIGDIDFFKTVNDTYGHIIGDYVLKGIGDILVNNIEDIGLVGRYGGEEFIIIVRNTNKDEIYKVVEKIRKRISKTKIRVKYNDCTKEFKITMTFGIAMSGNSLSIEEVISNADTALYKGKNNGRNQTNIY